MFQTHGMGRGDQETRETFPLDGRDHFGRHRAARDAGLDGFKGRLPTDRHGPIALDHLGAGLADDGSTTDVAVIVTILAQGIEHDGLARGRSIRRHAAGARSDIHAPPALPCHLHAVGNLDLPPGGAGTKGADAGVERVFVNAGGITHQGQLRLGLDHPNLAENVGRFDAFQARQPQLVHPGDRPGIIGAHGCFRQARIAQRLSQGVGRRGQGFFRVGRTHGLPLQFLITQGAAGAHRPGKRRAGLRLLGARVIVPG